PPIRELCPRSGDAQTDKRRCAPMSDPVAIAGSRLEHGGAPQARVDADGYERSPRGCVRESEPEKLSPRAHREESLRGSIPREESASVPQRVPSRAPGARG